MHEDANVNTESDYDSTALLLLIYISNYFIYNQWIQHSIIKVYPKQLSIDIINLVLSILIFSFKSDIHLNIIGLLRTYKWNWCQRVYHIV